jgi:multidrug efflux pump subunit AcrA (membrane-fusion protein)
VQLARANVNDVATIDDDERTRAAAQLAQTQTALRQAQSEYDKIAWAGDVGSTPQAAALEQATIAYETALANYNLATNPSDSQLAPLMAQLTQAELTLAMTLRPFRDIDFQLADTGIQQAEAAVELASLQLDEATIKAPFDGLIAELNISEGSTAGPQAPVARIVSQEVEVVIDVEENRLGQVFEGQNAALRVTAYPGQDFPAVVTSVAPVADKDTHTFAVKITPVDAEGVLRSGMYADVSILAEERQQTLVAPRAAVILVNNQETVYVVKENNTVEQREITTGLVNGNYAEILSGLEAGEIVVIAGQPNLVGGAPVEIVTGS